MQEHVEVKNFLNLKAMETNHNYKIDFMHIEK